jgi:hypothetical protein
MSEIIEIRQADMLQAINRAEIDIQISTAKQYPRDINAVLNKIETYATMDKETAEECFYVLRREDKQGSQNIIEGLSVRMAEIIAGAWGNLRVQSRIIGNDGKQITAQAICHDLETNVAVSKEVKRSILTKKGYTFSEEMQVVTGNAACSIAFRNAVLAVIPKAVTKKVINRVKLVSLGQAIDLETSRKNCLTNLAKAGVSEKMVLFYLGKNSVADIDQESIFVLRGTWNAIKEGTASVQECFIKPYMDHQTQVAADLAAKASAEPAPAEPKDISQMLDDMQKQPAVDPETGELFPNM